MNKPLSNDVILTAIESLQKLFGDITPEQMKESLIQSKPKQSVYYIPRIITDEYFYIDYDGTIGQVTFKNDETDARIIAMGNCYPTEAEAHKQSQIMKAIHEVNIKIAEINGDWKPRIKIDEIFRIVPTSGILSSGEKKVYFATRKSVYLVETGKLLSCKSNDGLLELIQSHKYQLNLIFGVGDNK